MSPFWVRNGNLSDPYDRPLSILQPSGSTTSYVYSLNTVSENKDGVSTSKTANVLGQLVSSTDAGGEVTYLYRADGQPDKITANGAETTLSHRI